MKRQKTSRVVVAAWSLAGLCVCAVALVHALKTGWPGGPSVWFCVVFGVLMTLSWIWPITIYFDGHSDSLDFYEAFLVVLLLVVSPDLTLLVFAAATICAQALKRRALARIAFCAGRVVTAAGAGVLVFVTLHVTPEALGYARVGAAIAAAACYFVVNMVATVSLTSTLGMPWRRAVLSGLSAKLLVTASGIAVAVPSGLLLADHPRYLPLAVLPAVMLRLVGAGHFYARHDRARLRGLFEATLDVNRSMGSEETQDAVLSAASKLLRAADASLDVTPPENDELAAPLEVGWETLWLRVSDRDRPEAFDEGDQTVLEALASVAAIALVNTKLYAEVQQQKEKLSIIASSLGEGVCAISAAGEVTFMNPAGASMLGWYGVGQGQDHDDEPILPAEATPPFLLGPALRAIALRRNVTSYDTRFERPDGSQFPVTMTASPVIGGLSPSGAVIVFRDTSERKAFEEQLARHAFQDALTGLANRRLLLDHLDRALLQAERNGSQVAILFCDIDRFKMVNDNLGHQMGDELLRVVADRLRRAVRPGDTLSRFGGDEFVVLLEGVLSADDAAAVAENVLHALRDPVVLRGGHEVAASVSVGVALSEYGKSRDDLLHDADVAMYRAKDKGRGGQVAMFDLDRMGGRSVSRLDLGTALHHAVERGEVEVQYQPLVSVTDRRIVGAEALVRWNHPMHGVLHPTQFIKIAEDNGTILAIGRLVLEEACRQAQQWQEELGLGLQIGVNLSARQFQQVTLAEDIAEVLRLSGLDPSLLCLEITESLAMDDVDLTTNILSTLRTLGVKLAIDDFGTGHSSLGYLARFPVNVVKIDQSFVRDIDHDPVKSAIVSAVVALSRAVHATTVVEGVESAAQLEELVRLGCEVVQGFFFARPVPASGFAQLLRANTTPTPPMLRVLPDESVAG